MKSTGIVRRVDELGRVVIPIELRNKFDIKEAIRITDDNFSFKKGVKYIPAYALFCLKDII